MFTPLTSALFQGALSPSGMEDRLCIPACYRTVVRRLEVLCASPVFKLAELRALLSGWGVDLPDLTFDFLPPLCPFSDDGTAALLCHMRIEEMECHFHVCYGEEQDTEMHHFRDLLLRLEARWLKEQLSQAIGRMCSDDDARLLLCVVLDEVYDKGMQMDTALACGFEEELCGQLKGVLASLYLELTICFGHLLADDDYMSFRHLMDTSRCPCAFREEELLEYDILRAGNRVKRLLCAGVSATYEADAMRLYSELAPMLAGRTWGVPSEAWLWQGILALENYCFLLHADCLKESVPSYGQLVDERWISERMDELCRERYDGHMLCTEARSALTWMSKKLGEPCLNFLSPMADCQGSLPRRLRGLLQHLQELYEQNYGCAFVPVAPEEKLAVKQVTSQAGVALNVNEIYSMFAFLSKVSAGETEPLMSPEHVRCLEADFIHFLRYGTRGGMWGHKVKIRSNYQELLYGLFFYYQKHRKCDRRALAEFLVAEVEGDIKLETLISNINRYIKRYSDFLLTGKLSHNS